ncbi:unnamed protein product [Somion occarium]|uniref:Uncharacterized protein n=1 Tax=Somion occarium TaxID=3059160 RepID=A0ABP1CNP5_9APHY
MSETVNAELPQSSICITLYSHGDTTYHWAIVAPIDRYYAAKFHATNRGSAGWLYKPWQYKSVDEVLSSSRTAVVVVKIGELGSNTIDALNSLLKDIPMTITNPEEADEPFGTKMRANLRLKFSAMLTPMMRISSMAREVSKFTSLFPRLNDFATLTSPEEAY